MFPYTNQEFFFRYTKDVYLDVLDSSLDELDASLDELGIYPLMD